MTIEQTKQLRREIAASVRHSREKLAMLRAAHDYGTEFSFYSGCYMAARQSLRAVRYWSK